MSLTASKDAWKEMFAIVEGTLVDSDGHGNSMWILHNKYTGLDQGHYRDEAYALKQARRKFKKIQRTVERQLFAFHDIVSTEVR